MGVPARTRGALLLAVLTIADVPVHCIYEDVLGDWELRFSPPVRDGESSPEVPNFAEGGLGEQWCYSSSPNINAENLNLNLEEKLGDRLNAPGSKRVKLTFTDRTAQHKSLDLAGSMLIERKGKLGPDSWSMAYDEGWLATLHGLHSKEGPSELFTLLQYRCNKNNPTCGRLGDQEDETGHVHGYESFCQQVMVGFYTSPAGKGCFVGRGTKNSTVHSYVISEASFAEGSADAGGVAKKSQVDTVYHAKTFEFQLPPYETVLELHRQGCPGCVEVGRPRTGATKRVAHVRKLGIPVPRDQCGTDELIMEDAVKQFPANFDWRDKFDDKWNTPVANQESCGSCYAIALTYMLQSHANLRRLEKYEKHGAHPDTYPDPIELSAHDAMACSYFNQGCQGGFSELVGLHAKHFGITTEDEMPYGTAARGVIQKCPAKSHTPDKLVFANDYGYLGGYQGRCGEARMMKALHEHGPIMAALEVDPAFSSANTTHLAGASMLQSDSDEEMSEKFPYDHHYKPALPGARMVVAKWAIHDRAACAAAAHGEAAARSAGKRLRAWAGDDAYTQVDAQSFALDLESLSPSVTKPYQEAKGTIAADLGLAPDCIHLELQPDALNQWEYANHAVNIVGWGSASLRNHTKPSKYWIVRNSWGSSFGEDGYAYVRRGVSYGGLESLAVLATVDETRGIPRTFEEEAMEAAGTKPGARKASDSGWRRPVRRHRGFF